MFFNLLIQAIVDGIMLGGIYSTLALGLSLVYGIMHVINWATGETLVIGLYLAYVLVSVCGFDPYMTIPITLAFMFILGFFMQKGLMNPLMEKSGSRAGHNALLFTAGFGYIISSLLEMGFGTLSKSTVTAYTGKAVKLGFVYLPLPKLISCVIAVAASILLYFLMQKTETGRAIRATSEDRKTAQLMGINSKLMFCIGFGLSFALLGLSASLLIPYYPITPYVGANFGFKAFMICVIGGEGNVLGALGGGMFVALVEKIFGSLISDPVAEIAVFVLFIVVLLVKPEGLMNKKRTA